MREVAVIGVGLTKFGRFPEKNIIDLGVGAILQALGDVNFREIEAAFCGCVFGGMVPGNNILAQVGMTGIPIVTVDNACASAGSALRLAHQGISAGFYDIALAFGVEKMPRGFIKGTQFEDWQRLAGLAVNPLYWALRARRHMEDYGLTREQLAMVAVKNHKNGALNSYAMYRKGPFTVEETLNSRMVCDPLTLFMICAPNEGAAAAVLCRKDIARKYVEDPILIAGVALESQLYSEPRVWSLVSSSSRSKNLSVTTRAARKAYKIAGLRPKDIDVAEVQDTSSWNEIEALEELEFCKEGEGGLMTEEGLTEIGGDIAVNPSGGCISCGEPIGASGLRMVAEIFWQLRGKAGKRQVPNAEVGLCHNVGGSGNSTVIILKRP